MEIGARLKEAREAKNLSLDDIQKITKIQTRYLQAIEKGNYDVMPGKFYVRAFIKEYAFAVDLDPEILFEEHRAELPATNDESAINYTRVQRSRKDTSSNKSPAILSFLPTIFVVLLIIGILFVVWWFYQNPDIFGNDESNEQTENSTGPDEVTLPPDQPEGTNGSEDEENGSEVEEEPVDEPEPEVSEPKLELVEYENANSTYNLINPGDEVKLVLTNTERNWLEVENGKGKSFYEKTFENNESPLEFDLTGEEQIYLRFGEPTTISITVNGVPLELSEEISPTAVQKVWINVQTDSE